ncbi:glycosyltransferase family 4 protein [Thermococcus barophilus]|uniref:Glycosyl transferase, group 1 n=1 Tax=Thermococcus barophilus (strain DSM 11836 / MP) TaxID=391623 RepID=F0LLX4_THEBM|nr:glycosyltransferase family 4 protein [Thermococcus barophilus]ADT85073.1 glycosyl transferase, group 1 [Thermococcus barophilus MP]
MRILQFVPYFLPYPGGQERYVYNLSKYLVKMGHEVRVITSNFPKSKKFEEIDGITVERYNLITRPLRNPIVPKFLQVPKRFKEFDIVHIHNEHAFSSMVAAYAKKKEDFPLVLTNHGQLKFGNYIADTIEKTYMKTFGKKILELSDIIVVNSESDKEFLSTIAPKISNKTYILHNAIDPEVLTKLAKEADGNEWTMDADIKILYVGRLIRRKGVEWLIKAIKIIKNSTSKKIKCILVGEGEDRNYFEMLVREYNLSDSVVFAGRISDKKLAWLYENSDIFVLPSLSEGLPTTILEAMYFSLPVVATDIPGNRDHFKDVAILVPPKDEKALANSLLMLLENENLAKQLSKAGKKLVEEKYTWDRVAREYEKLYKNIIDQRRLV